MKHLIILSFLILFQHVLASGQQTQTLALAQYTQLKQVNLLTSAAGAAKHGRRVHVGETLMIAGGALMVVSTVGFATNQAATEEDASHQILYALVAVGGLSLFIPGVITFAFGLRAERREKFTIISRRNQVGLAYNF